MEGIIGLLFLAIPVIFGLIGKKLEKSSEAAPPVIPQPDLGERIPEEMPRSVRMAPQPKSDLQAKPMKTNPRKNDPIDPKKLVIYSEIMKPKFKE